MNATLLSLILAAASSVGAVFADAPKVVAARAVADDGRWTITVTMSHQDTGWDHYAKGFEVLTPDNKRIAYGEIARPHLGQRNIVAKVTGIKLPKDLSFVLIRTRCSLVGWSSDTERLDLPGR